MAIFKKISSNPKKMMVVDSFYGVNLTDAEGKIVPSRSPDAINMIRDSLGKVKKRFGYTLVHNFSECIYGIYFYISKDEKKMVVHSGDKLYIESDEGYQLIYSDMNRSISCGVQFNCMLIIADGKTLLYYNGEKVGAVVDEAYVPTVVTGRSPDGGGEFYEPVNMIGKKRKERFKGDGKNKTLHLTAENIENVLYVKYYRENKWETLESLYDYSYSYVQGTVTLNLSSVESAEDNYEVCYTVKNDEYLEIINTSSVMTLYGVYGAMDRIFLAGNSVYQNRDYYSEINNPFYFPDTNYSILGRDESPIVGYSLVADNLVAHKYNELNNANMILRYGTVDENGNAIFRISGTYSGSGAVSKNGFGHIDNEPAYFSSEGICAITPNDVMGERESQLRSYYLNGKLLKEADFDSAYAVTHNQFFMLLLNEKIYILDSLRYSSEGNNSFSHRQYDSYLWTGIPANILFSDGKTLFFGGKNGEVCRFYNAESDSSDCYLDNGKNFEAYWQLPKFLGDDFTKKKTIMHFSALFDDYSKNTKIQYKDTLWKDVVLKNGNSMFFSKRLHIKNTQDAELRIYNSHNEPLNINTVKITYINGGRIE